jgi:hypothetical protein
VKNEQRRADIGGKIDERTAGHLENAHPLPLHLAHPIIPSSTIV